MKIKFFPLALLLFRMVQIIAMEKSCQDFDPPVNSYDAQELTKDMEYNEQTRRVLEQFKTGDIKSRMTDENVLEIYIYQTHLDLDDLKKINICELGRSIRDAITKQCFFGEEYSRIIFPQPKLMQFPPHGNLRSTQEDNVYLSSNEKN